MWHRVTATRHEGQLVRVVVKSLRETPQSLPVPAGDVALAAMQRAFPCPGRGRDLTDAHRASSTWQI
jgi:hypothetical protein